ncbi:MAG: helix-turn-helix domain-containing protein [Thermoproteota archaeon]|nr:helix-turn-helix domain-containing protein [Thermoproteota archaeon]
MVSTEPSSVKVGDSVILEHSAQSITKRLHVTDATTYNDIKFLTEKSRGYAFDLAKGTYAFIYQKSIEGINQVLTESWNAYTDNKKKNINSDCIGFHKTGIVPYLKEFSSTTPPSCSFLTLA